jgi:translation initiation factor IF-2
MAVDKTEVPTGTVIGIGVIVLSTLVAVQYSVTSYFHSMYGDEQQRKVLGVESGGLREAHARETQQLARINEGMQQVAGALGNGVRPAAITPTPSTDLQALQGWGQRPRVVPNPPPARGDLPAGADTTPRPATPAPAAPAAAAPAPAANAPSAQVAAPMPTAAAAPTLPAGAAPAAAAH